MAAANATQALREALSDAHAGRHGQASLKARLVLATEPHNPEAHYVLGLAALIANQPGGGLESIQEAARLAPQEPRYAFALGMALDRAGERHGSIEAYRRSLAARPGHFETAANLGSALERAGQHAEALEAYQVALLARPSEAPVLNGIGMCLLAMGQSEAAERAFASAVSANRAFAAAHNHRSIALQRLGRHEDAVDSLREAIRLRPDYAEAWFNLGNQYYELGHRDAAIEAVRQAVRIRPGYTDAWSTLGQQYFEAGQEAQAREALDRALALEPGNATASFLLSALASTTPDHPPDAYVRSVFDRFAPEFDARLTERLEYRIPQKMAAFLEPLRASLPQPVTLLDLGCGTGLSGLALRSMAGELAGVDLSAGMLERARARNVYDSLHESGITPFLRSQAPGRWSVLVALDVFIYVGALDDVFREAARVLPSGGLLAFSVERLDDAEGYQLQRSCRYAHSRPYLDAQASAAGLEPCQFAIEDIRLERGEPVPGLLAAYRKP